MARMACRKKKRKMESLSTSRGITVVGALNDRTHLYDVEELVSVNAAISIHIVQFEIPPQLVLHLPSHHQAQGCHILHEVDVTVLQGKPPSLQNSTLNHPCIELSSEVSDSREE